MVQGAAAAAFCAADSDLGPSIVQGFQFHFSTAGLRMSSSAIQVAKTATYLPDLVEVQRASFKWFLDEGLIEELDSFSPITDYTGKLELHFVGNEYRLKRPRHDVEEAKRRDATFASQMYVTCRLVNKETGEIKEQEVFIGELPLMTVRSLSMVQRGLLLIRLCAAQGYILRMNRIRMDDEHTMPVLSLTVVPG